VRRTSRGGEAPFEGNIMEEASLKGRIRGIFSCAKASASKREPGRPKSGFGRTMREAPPKMLAQRARSDRGRGGVRRTSRGGSAHSGRNVMGTILDASGTDASGPSLTVYRSFGNSSWVSWSKALIWPRRGSWMPSRPTARKLRINDGLWLDQRWRRSSARALCSSCLW
jgi:hypothetical protein